MSTMLVQLVALLCSSLLCAATIPRASTNVIDPCLPVSGSVTSDDSFLTTVSDNFSHCPSGAWKPNGTNAFRVWSYSDMGNDYPLVVVARQGNAVLSWTVPFTPQGFDFSFDEANRTLCPITPPTINDTTPVFVDLFTNSLSPVDYSITVEPVPNYELSLNETQSVTIGANTPQIRYFRFPDTTDVVTIEAESDNEKCAVISVQNNSCPANDLLKNAKSIGLFQTMSTSAFLTVKANQVENREFLLVMITTNYSVCHKGDFSNLEPLGPGENETLYPASLNDTVFQQTMNITIRKEKPARKYIGALLIPPAIFIGVGIMVCFLMLVSRYVPHCFWSPWCECIKSKGHEENGAINQPGERTPLISSQALPRAVEDHTVAHPLAKEEKHLRLHHMLGKDRKTLESQYGLYGWNTITVGIFYGLPAFQLVLAQQQLVHTSGNQDQCFYNFKCARPAGVFSAFNNIWSNIGFFLLGIVFIIVVMIRHVRYRQKKRDDKEYVESHGIPQFFGIYYAMGTAMIMEGFMSSFYHICPRNANFQFDTAFMFIIGGLMLVKIFQNRHPELHASSVVAFFAFSVVIFFTLLGIWFDMRNPVAVRCVLFFIAITVVIIFLVSFYHFHRLTFCAKPMNKNWHKCRFWKFSIAAAMSLLIVILGIALHKSLDFPTVILILFLSNAGYFLVWYIALKLYHKEPWTITPLILPVVFGVLWLMALKYYFSNVSNWQVTPAESRGLNKKCIVFDFYDNHDMWHFLATSAIFATFMFILTIDDGLAHTSREKIHVF